MPSLNENGSLHCGWNVLTTFRHGRTLASDSRQDKRVRSRQDRTAEGCGAAQGLQASPPCDESGERERVTLVP